jgi:ribosome-binding protein aMBF1 (putative translation factor)
MSDAPLTPLQMKAARELLGWSQMDVANRVGLSEWVIGFYERGERLIRARHLRRMRSIFETAGVEFIAENGGGAGVRLRKAPLKAATCATRQQRR